MKTEQQNIKINNQNQKLKDTNNELQKMSKFREINTQMIVHDLKNPLNRIISTSKNNDKSRDLYESSQFMLNLVENILNVTKIEQTGLTIVPTAIDLQEIILLAYESTDFLFRNKGVIFEFIEDYNYNVLAENEILKRIFINLFTNAVKFTPSGGKICVLIQRKEELVEIEIKDSGIGIKNENINKIFNIYQKDYLPEIEDINSNGIGLFFVKKAIEALGSQIYVKSEINVGTSFIFNLKVIECFKKSKKINSFKDKRIIQLNQEEKNILKNIVDELEQTELFEISKIKKVIYSIDLKTENIIKWKKSLEDCLVNYNTNLYYKLIDVVKN